MTDITTVAKSEDFDKILLNFKAYQNNIENKVCHNSGHATAVPIGCSVVVDDSHLVVVHFYAPWAAQCQQINDVLTELQKQLTNAAVKIVKVEAESLPDVSQRFNITAVPTCLLLKDSKEVDRVNGANAAELTKKVQQYAAVTLKNDAPKEDLNSRLKKLINSAPVIAFIKGNPDQPKCGFTRTLVQILNEQKVKFSSFDILADEEVRQGLKEYSNWPTYPQLYIKGELVGGLDIVKELVADGTLQSMLPADSSLGDRLKELINRERVMLFMKGSPDAPRCGFSKSIIEILDSKNIKYGHFDILQDETVRQGLKEYSNWPTYPQLYVGGDLVGGLDIVKELNETGELESTLNEPAK